MLLKLFIAFLYLGKILAYFFFEHKEVIAIGILAMSYGDGFASLLGIKYGKRKYKIFGEEKSYVGSFGMLIFTFLTLIIALVYYLIPLSGLTIISLLEIALVAAVVEGITPRGLDNLSVHFVTVILYWIVIDMGSI